MLETARPFAIAALEGQIQNAKTLQDQHWATPAMTVLAYVSNLEVAVAKWKNAHFAIAEQVAGLQKKANNQARHIISVEAKLDESRSELRRMQRERDAFRDALDPETRAVVIGALP